MKVFFASSLALCSGLQLAWPKAREFAWASDNSVAPLFWLGEPSEFKTKVEAEVANGFASRTLLPPFSDRIAAVAQAASSDPCAADVLTGGFGCKYGYGARAMLASSELQLALYFNASFAICDGDAKQPGIAWEKYFDNAAGFSVCSDPVKCLKSETEAPWIGNSMAGQLKNVDKEFQTSLLHSVMSSLFTFGSDTQSQARDALRTAGLEEGAPYIGVHMRRGDKISEAPVVPTEEYAASVLDQLREHPTSTVFVASDDENAGDEMLAILQASIPDVTVIQLFSEMSNRRKQYHSDDETTMELLTDILALTSADVFIGTQSSSLGRLVYFRRSEDAPSISLDGDWLDSYV